MKCEHDDCFTCPYPDCIKSDNPYVSLEKRREYSKRYKEKLKRKKANEKK